MRNMFCMERIITFYKFTKFMHDLGMQNAINKYFHDLFSLEFLEN